MGTIRRVGSCMVLLWGLLIPASIAEACPVCRTETGEKVRAGIFNDQFGVNAAMALLPFPVLISIVAIVHFGPPRWLRAPKGRPARSRVGHGHGG